MKFSFPLRSSTLGRWLDIVEIIDVLSQSNGWLFRGHERSDWPLQTSLERECGSKGADVELQILWHFVRTAPRLLPSHLIPHDEDVAAWLGLIQHYGGPTRLLDVTRSPYVALFFAFESPGDQERELWAIEHAWCMSECARIMAEGEDKPRAAMERRTVDAQAQLAYSLVRRQPYPDGGFASFKPFTGVLPVDPWKPDVRQIAQQAMFLCAANPALSFLDNFAAHELRKTRVIYRFALPATLREEVLHRLATMNVSAATLFPDLGGLARSLRTHTVEWSKRKGDPL